MEGQITIFDFLKPQEVYQVKVSGLCDDPHCPKCNYWLEDPDERYGECPQCGAKIDFKHWFEVNRDEVIMT